MTIMMIPIVCKNTYMNYLRDVYAYSGPLSRCMLLLLFLGLAIFHFLLEYTRLFC